MLKTILTTLLLVSAIPVSAKTVSVSGSVGVQAKSLGRIYALKRANKAIPADARIIRIDVRCIKQGSMNIGYDCYWEAVYETEPSAK